METRKLAYSDIALAIKFTICYLCWGIMNAFRLMKPDTLKRNLLLKFYLLFLFIGSLTRNASILLFDVMHLYIQ